MCKRTTAGFWTGLLFAGALAGAANVPGEGREPLGLGRQATEAEMRAWDHDVSPAGEGLPAGKGTAQEGARVFSTKCASCHGVTGTEGPAPRLVGGQGMLATKNPVKTVGSYWPYATTLYDYIRRAMPFTAPQSLTSDEVYAVAAWILAQNGIIKADAVMDAQTLPNVRMPNRDGFVPDPRPDVPNR
ncbi:MAG: cytochrome c [Nitrospirae bacterium]|nr:MAG: cytochrome c [Nitrospirota bacterium]